MILDELISQFSKLPGIARKGAIKIVYDLLEKEESFTNSLANNLLNLHLKIVKCNKCQNFSENKICSLCLEEFRERELLCIVESPQDLMVIESTKEYNGLYFVLHGHLDPLNNIKPEDLKLPLLFDRIERESFKEVILATEFSIEGDVTAAYISNYLNKFNIKVTRLASGLPVGSSVGYSDKMTVLRSLKSRLKL